MDIQKIEELINVLQGSRTEELSVKKGDCTVCIRKGKKPKVAASSKQACAKSAAASVEETSNEKIVVAPMVGIFRANDAVLKTGSVISTGQVVGTIESMKLHNDVFANLAGEITEVLVEDGTPVEYGQLLFKIASA